MTDPIPMLPPAGGHAFDPATAAPHSAATPSWVQMSRTPLHTALGGVGQDHIGPAITVWPTGQDSDAAQRVGRYRTETLRHPQRTLPAVPAQAIGRYTEPGQTVFDPFIGSGTTVVEAVYAGRQAIGCDVDLRWVDLTVRNVQYAHHHGATTAALVGHKDARHLGWIPRRMRGSVDLVVATPPVRLDPPTNPARSGSNADLVGQLEIDLRLALHAWTPLLHTGTVVVLITRLLYRAHQTLDLTVPIARAAEGAGLGFVERVAALRTPLRDARRHPQPRTAGRRRGRRPRAVHNDALVYRVPDASPTWWRGRR
jgi:modification methylase